MKKVLYTATVDIHIKSFHLPYLKLLHDMGYKVYVATNGNEEFPYCDEKIVVPFERRPFKFNNIKAIFKLKKIIDKENFNLIHCHTPMGSVVTRIAARKARKKGTKVIYTAHGFHFYKGAPLINWLLFYPVEKWLARYTDVLITINKEDFNLARKKFRKRCKDIQYVPGIGIDLEDFKFTMTQQEKEKLKKSLGLNKNNFILIFPARLDKNKNQGFLIDAMKTLVNKNSNVHLLLPGNDELNGYYQNIVNEKKLNKNIHFLGYRNDIPKLMKISDVAVSSSLREGLPVNIIEAFACGLPVVALNCRGMRDLIENEKSGYIINNIDEFVEKIIDIYNKCEREKYSYYNMKIVKKYDYQKIIEIMKKIYNIGG